MLATALALLMAIEGDCLRQDAGFFYDWTEPFDADDEQEWREAISRGDGQAAYELLRAHGGFKVFDGPRKGLPLCDTGLTQFEVYTRLIFGALGQVMPDAALLLASRALEMPDLSNERKAGLLSLRACLLNHGAHGDAMADIQEALRLRPEDPTLIAQYAYMKGGYVNAEGIFHRVDAARGVIDAIEAALATEAERGAVLTEAVSIYAFLPADYGGDGRRALHYAQEKAAIDPVIGNWDIGRAYFSLGRYRDAERHLLIGLDQPDVDARQAMLTANVLSNVYIALGRVDEAFEVQYEMRDRYKKHSPPLYRIGLIAARTRSRQREGIAHLNAWLEHPAALNSSFINCEFAPNYAYAHYRLGQLHDQLDEIAEARAQYRKALEYAPDLKEAELALLRLPNR